MTSKRCLDEGSEQGVSLVGLGLKFWMKLYPNIPRVIFDFYDLD